MERLDDDIGSLLECIYVPQAHVVESILNEDDSAEPWVCDDLPDPGYESPWV